MLRLGILDFDTSHVVEFTKRINHVGIAEEQWVNGAKVTIGCPGDSKVSPERIPSFIETMKKLGVPLVKKPEEMIGKVDGMLIEAVDGSVHYERARPFLEAGIPCFVDKPFTCSKQDATKLIQLADHKKTMLFSSSALRYAPEVTHFVEQQAAKPKCSYLTYGPASQHPRNPGLFHYGIHAVEMLFTLMGPGCKRVSCHSDTGADVVTGHWNDGRFGSIRGIREGKSAFGFLAFTDREISHHSVPTTFIYRELLKAIIKSFETSKSDVDPNVSLEIVAFIEAANTSAANHGAIQSISI